MTHKIFQQPVIMIYDIFSIYQANSNDTNIASFVQQQAHGGHLISVKYKKINLVSLMVERIKA